MTTQPIHVIVDNPDNWTALQGAILAGVFAIAGVVIGFVLEHWSRRGKIVFSVEGWDAQYYRAGPAVVGPIGPSTANHAIFTFEFDVFCNRDIPAALRDVGAKLRLGARSWELLFADRSGCKGLNVLSDALIRVINVGGHQVSHFTVMGTFPAEAIPASDNGELYLVAREGNKKRHVIHVPHLREK